MGKDFAAMAIAPSLFGLAIKCGQYFGSLPSSLGFILIPFLFPFSASRFNSMVPTSTHFPAMLTWLLFSPPPQLRSSSPTSPAAGYSTHSFIHSHLNNNNNNNPSIHPLNPNPIPRTFFSNPNPIYFSHRLYFIAQYPIKLDSNSVKNVHRGE